MAGNNNFGGRKFEPAGQVQVGLPLGRGPQLSGAPLAQAQGNVAVARPYEPTLVQQPIPSPSMAGQMPRGANAIPVIFPRTPFTMGGSMFNPMPQAPPQPQYQPQYQQPQPQAVPFQQPQLGGDQEIHVIEVRAAAPNGQEMLAPYEAVFPKGTRILGASEKNRTALAGGQQSHLLEIRGLARDNREYAAPFEAVFPEGSRILGVTARPPA